VFRIVPFSISTLLLSYIDICQEVGGIVVDVLYEVEDHLLSRSDTQVARARGPARPTISVEIFVFL
jgi:hypothetical protein